MAPVEKSGVVDQSGNNWGLEELVVGDASIIPAVLAANTVLPTIMTAENIAHALKARECRGFEAFLAKLCSCGTAKLK